MLITRYPMEMHMVHVKVDEADPMNVWDGLAVVGQMFEVNWLVV